MRGTATLGYPIVNDPDLAGDPSIQDPSSPRRVPFLESIKQFSLVFNLSADVGEDRLANEPAKLLDDGIADSIENLKPLLTTSDQTRLEQKL